MTAPYGLISDLHCHEWSAFATLDHVGRNTRLMAICHEVERCCDAVLNAGGNTVWIAGDVFHTRGSVAPSVFNPVKALLESYISAGVRFRGIAGNHDLTGKEANRLGSSVEMLNIDGTAFFHKPDCFDGIALVPWISDQKEYLSAIHKIAVKLGPQTKNYDLIVHLGIDGTLSSMPDHGVSAAKLASFGFKRVFSGHYHNHKDFGNGVYSIGATTHQTWGCVGTKAGFMLVYPDHVQWFASHAPEFIELNGTEDEADIPLIVDGHFVRARIGEADAAKVQEWRDKLISFGAKGVVIQAIPATASSKRLGVSAKSLSAIDQSITDYVSERKMPPEVGTLCADLLAEARAV